jgi:tetratricopeptide (TPR) repeat protein
MSETVGLPPIRRWRRRLVAGSIIAGFLACGVFVVWFYVLGPQPPEVALPDDDPGAALDIAEARTGVKRWPFRSSKWGRLGMVLGTYGFHRQAGSCFARAAELSPSSPRWPYLQGTYEVDFDIDASVTLFERSVRLDGSSSASRLTLAETLLRLARVDEAEEHFQFVLRTDPANARALFGMGRVANDRGDLPASLDYLKHSARLEPRFRAAHLLLAEINRRLGDQEQAYREQSLAAPLSEIMNWPDPYFTRLGPPFRGQKEIIARADDLLRDNRAQDALQLLKEMPAVRVSWYKKQLLLGRAYFKLGDHAAAEKALSETLRLNPDNLEALSALSNVFEEQGNYSAAAEQLRKALEFRPDSEAFQIRLSRCLANQGDRAAAIGVLQNAVRRKPVQLRLYHDLAQLLADDGRTAEAREALKRALELAPDDRKSQVMLERLVESPSDSAQSEKLESCL